MTSEEHQDPASASAPAPLQFSIADAAPVEEAPVHLLPFPTVAIGASAGGVEALLRFFHATQAESGCAYVVLLHLDPKRESMLAELLGRATRMPVVQVDEATKVEAERVYIVAPGNYLEMHEGALVPSPIRRRPPRPKVVDQFMVSLAQDQRDRAIGVVLTGTDGDGAIGVKAIKSEGGMTIAQTPESAAHPGMPQSAVDTGMVDAELAIEDMPAAIKGYVATLGLVHAAANDDAAIADRLGEVLNEVRVRSGLDFRGYKRPMLQRRVRRRMGLTRIADMATYILHLRSTPAEVAALTADFLISVTEFFREPDAWAALAEEVIPQMLQGKSEGDNVRVWVPACATGEEAYSIAMVLLEHPRTAELRLKIQVFATDVDRRALEIARTGQYGATLEQTVSPQRRHRFFAKVGERYRVRKALREVVLFAPHNLASDPPFSHMDLLSCRNLLIYLEPELQRRLLNIFHFALEPERFLFLGKSETVGSMTNHFVPASHGSRIYRRIGPARLKGPNKVAMLAPVWHRDGPPPGGGTRKPPDYAKLIREALLEHSVGAGILTDRDANVLYFYGPVQSFLDQPEGTPTTELYTLLSDELSGHVRALMHTARVDNRRSETMVVLREGADTEVAVRASVQPLRPAAGLEGLMLLSFSHAPRTEMPPRPTSEAEFSALRAIEEELRNTKHELRTAIEELEAANEELKVANEEAMSMNEELQSTNEELETSKEELQSVNEELVTVNNELQVKVIDLESANNDLGNLLSSTHIPTLFLDRKLRIRRYTPAATQMFSLIDTDVDRPLADIASRSDMAALLADARRVLAELAPVQQEELTPDGRAYLRRVLPYRTRDDRIDGVVVTFTDITDLKRATEALRRFATAVQRSSDVIIVLDRDGAVLAWNEGAQRLYGPTEAEVMGRSLLSLLPAEAHDEFQEQLARALSGQSVQGAAMRRRSHSGALIDVSASLSPVPGEDGKPAAVALIERDITQNKRIEAELRASEQRFRMLADSAPVLIWLADAQGRLLFVNRECERLTGQVAANLQGRRWIDLLHPDDLPRVQTAAWRAQRDGDKPVETTARLLRQDGASRWVKILVLRRGADDGYAGGVVGCMFDIDAQMGAEEALRQADRRKDEFLAMLGHELRNPLVPIRNAAEVLNKLQSGDARVGWVRDTLVRQVGHVTRLVDDLLDISRVTRGTMSLHLEPVELAGVVQRAVDTSRPLIERRHHRFELVLPGEPVWVEGDSIRLTQVFENLLTNAAKYTDERGEISLTLARDGDAAIVHVRDNGMGIDPAVQGRMFELFVQDSRSVDRSQGGLGIGLALVRHLVDLHGGSVDAQSAGVGQGSDFIVSLPLLPGVPAEPEPALEKSEASGGRILLLDDDVDGAESLAVLLKLSGFEVAVAHELDAGLRAAARLVPQVVILDLAMPGADGFEIARRLRAMPALAQTQYVALSGFGSSEDIARSKLAGFAKHFVKPADPDEIQSLLARLVAQHAADEAAS